MPAQEERKKIFLYISSASHNAYRNMAANAPAGFEFVQSEYMAHGMARSAAKGGMGSIVKKAIGHLQPIISPYYNHAHILLNTPKVRKFYSNDYDLIHSGQSLLETNLPYVLDFEHASVFCGYNQYGLCREGFARALEKVLLNPKLKKLLAWSGAAGKSLTEYVKNPVIAEKLETVYPVMAVPKRVPRTDKTFNFLWIGNNFYEKGGYETILAFERIKKKYDCRLTLVGGIPKEIFDRYGNGEGENGKLVLSPRVPYERVVEYYSNSDVFVFPTHYDTYGFVVPEALAFGLPVISTNNFSMPELVEHEKTGLLVKTYFSCFGKDWGYAYPTLEETYRKRIEITRSPPEWYVKLLAEAMERMITDSDLRKKCSQNALDEATKGKFSPTAWKEKMKNIYGEASE